MDFLKLALTSIFSFVVLFLIAKLMGRKQISQLDFFDYVMGISVGSIAAEMATELEAPWKPLGAMVIYGVIGVFLDKVTTKNQRSRRILSGSPLIILDDGKFYRENMQQAKLDLSEFMVMCREQGYFDLSEIRTAVFEFNGKLSILPMSASRPVTPDDLQLKPEPEHFFVELIMDGHILEHNIKQLGYDLTWLDKKLQEHGYHTAKDVFLAVSDRGQNLYFYRKEN